MVIAGQFAERAAFHQFFEALLAILEALGGHPFGWADRGHGVERIRNVERAILAAQEAGRRERLQLLLLADAFEPLADVDERWDGRVVRPAHPSDPRADVWSGHGLGRHIARMPVILMPRVQNVP